MQILLMFLVLCVATVQSTSLAADRTAVGKRAFEFTMEDQFEKSWSWSAAYRGKPTVLVMSDRSGSEFITAWTNPLTKQYAKRVSFVAMADVSAAPFFIKGLLRSKFREAYTNSILMDWDGDAFEHYHVQDGVPNVLYISPDGVVRLHVWGKGSQGEVSSFTRELDRLISQSTTK